jgi:hypothetical protein
MKHRALAIALSACSCTLPSGCSIFSPVPLWELAKGTGVMVSAAIPYGSSEASNTVYHLHPTFRRVCIEYNPDSAVTDVVPAIQIELRKHQIESRVYEAGPLTAATLTEECRVWLKYTAYIGWDYPPMSGNYKSYVDNAALKLETAGGEVLATSHYELGSGFGLGKWASTQSKLAPVVTALITGFQN